VLAIEDSAAPIRDSRGNVTGVVMVFRDVTERRRAHEALQTTDQRVRATFSQAAVGIGICDLTYRFVDANQKFSEILGYSLEELRSLTFMALTHPEDRELTHRSVRQLLAGEIPHYFIEKRYVRKDGTIIWSRTTVTLMRSANGEITQFIGVVEDISEQKQTQETLRVTRERAEEVRSRLAAVVESSDDAIISKTLDGVITTWNEGAERMFGYAPREIVGKPVTVLFPLGHIDEEATIIEKLRRGERIDHYETVRMRKDGALLDVSLTVSPIRDVSGAVIGASKIARDITARKRVETALREETRVLELLNSAGRAIAAQLDLHTLVQTVTDAATQLSGAKFGAFFYNVTDQKGESFLLYALTGAPREAFEKFGMPRNTPIFNPTFAGEGVVRSADITKDARYGKLAPHHGMPKGHLPVCSYLAVPVVSRSGQVLGGLFFGHPDADVFTERAERLVVGVAAQAAIAIDNARLYEASQREIASRERAEAALRETDKRKDEFLATLAHELRNPLAPIRQAALISKTPTATEAQKRWSHDVISRQVHHMALLLDDLLDISRITRGTLELRTEMTDLAAVLEAAVETARPMIDAKRHTFTIEAPPDPVYFAADPLRLAQVLSNLLTNAAKYTDPEGQIRLRASATSDSITISVSDNGIGITKDGLSRLFAMFSQVSASQDRSEGGLGIGLALTKGLVELHGGTVEAKSAGAGRGSEFIVSLPRRTLRVRRQGDPIGPRSIKTVTRRVLIADDNRDAAESLAILLRMDGHEVTVVHDGKEALAVFAADRPEVVLLDIGMPELNGYEVARQVRENSLGRAVTLIAVTGWGQDADKARALAAGFNHHFTKPVEPERLAELLRSEGLRS
jgi:PAS domain S-box-containing protein